MNTNTDDRQKLSQDVTREKSKQLHLGCLLYFYLLAGRLGMRKWKAFSFKPFLLSKLTDLDVPKMGGGLAFHQL